MYVPLEPLKRPASRARTRRLRTAGRRHTTRLPQLEQLEPRLMLAISSPPTTPLATGPQPLALQLGPLDANASLDLLALSALGQLTTALNAGDGRWQSAHTADLGLGPLAGLKLTNFDSDAYRDLILQGPNSISVALGDGSGQFTPHQTITPGPPGSLAPSAVHRCASMHRWSTAIC